MRKAHLIVLALIVAGGVVVYAATDTSPADQQKQMEMMMKLATPGAQHAKLKMMAGNFKGDVTIKMAPDAPEQKLPATTTNQMILGDRYLKMDYAGEMMGMPYKGIGITGFDNQKQKYVSTWVDSMGTGMMVSEGTADATGNVITQTSEMDCPLQPGTKLKMRMVTTIKDENSNSMEMFQTGPDGKEFRCMAIDYTRTK